MIFTREDVINCAKVLDGSKVSVLFSTDELNEIENYVTKLKPFKRDILKEEDHSAFRSLYLSAWYGLKNKPAYHYVYFVRRFTSENIWLTFNIVPEFKGHVEVYSQLLRFARNIKFDTSTSEVLNLDDLPESFEVSELPDKTSVLEVIKFSRDYGLKDSHEKRKQSAVQAKLIEELGEHSVEVQIQNGITYKEPGKDGIAGEAVDIAICAIDSFALEYPDKTVEEIYNLFQEYMILKLNKWKSTI